MIIDFHTHIFPPKIIERREEYCHKDRFFSELYSNPKAKLATVEDLINNMDECEINMSVLLNINWVNHDICVEVNDYILDCVARYPLRLAGLCSIQPSAGDKAIKELERCIKYGASGLGEIRLDVDGFKLMEDGLIKNVVDIIMRNNCIAVLHSSEPVGHQYQGKGLATPDVIYKFISLYPDLKAVCAHWGGGLPFYALMPEVRGKLGNVYFDTAASPYLYQAEIFESVIGIIGSGKLLFGSDYPLMSPQRVIDYMRTIKITGEDQDNILSNNAMMLLKH